MTDDVQRLKTVLRQAREWIYREEAPDFARNFETLDHVRDGETKELLKRIDAVLQGTGVANERVFVVGAGGGGPGSGYGGGGWTP